MLYTEEEVNEMVNEQRAKTVERIVHKTDTVVIQSGNSTVKVVRGIRSQVGFGLARTNIEENQELNVLVIADYMKQFPDAKATVTGYADNGTGNREINLRLAKQRAEVVANQLINKYGISKDRLTISSMKDREQPFQTNDWNRVVIIIAD